MRSARVVDNRTPWAASCVPSDLPSGREVVSVVVKATWEIDDQGRARLPLIPRAVRRSSIPRHPNARSSSSLLPADVAPAKPGAEVVLVGTATPPRGKEVIQMPVSLRMQREDEVLVHKRAMVVGRRRWEHRTVRGLTPTSTEPVEPTPLSWENAYGGSVRTDDGWLREPRNPVGRGLVGARLAGGELPTVEDPEAPTIENAPRPAGFGPVAASWEPRAGRAGTRDDLWARERRPLPPVDFDLRFFCIAPDDQWFDGSFESGDAVEVSGVRADGPWRFALPPGRPRLIGRIHGEEEERLPRLDTVVIDSDAGLVELHWRSTFRLPRKSAHLEWVRVVHDELPDEHLDDLASRHRRSAS